MARLTRFRQQANRRCAAGKEKDFATGKFSANLCSHFNSIFVRHHHITEHQVGNNFFGKLDGLPSGICSVDVKSALLKNGRQTVSNGRFVVNNKDSVFSSHGTSWG